ncbi:putative signal peptide-containing protein [Cryptosporidium canis]|uniref:Signal peptide-containing protein n=1 Tax=Cryptosporidium canis TaxID=195482 RepID=A0A9D5DHM8_9CRYT|nr:putative signal peptide-containing protein [Cryptosporidium canis]
MVFHYLVFLLIISNFIYSEDLTNPQHRSPKKKIVQSYNLDPDNYAENTDQHFNNINHCDIIKLINFQIKSNEDVIYARMFFYKFNQKWVKYDHSHEEASRITYETIFSSLPQKLSKPLARNSHHARLADRLVIQGFKIKQTSTRNNSGSLELFKFRSLRGPFEPYNTLQNALKESILNSSNKYGKGVKIYTLNDELKDMQIIKARNSNSGEILVNNILHGIKEKNKPFKTNDSKLNNPGLIIPVPPKQDKDIVYNLSHNNEGIGYKHEDDVNILHLSIPEVPDHVNQDNIKTTNGDRVNKNLPPGADEELLEFFSRNANKNDRTLNTKLQGITQLKPLSTKASHPIRNNPYRPLKQLDGHLLQLNSEIYMSHNNNEIPAAESTQEDFSANIEY